MFATHSRVICPILLCGLLFLAACTSAPPTTTVSPTAIPTRSLPTPTPTIAATPTLSPAPQHYTARVVLRGLARPDDLAFDQQGRLLFTDSHNGTVNRLNANGTVTVLLRGLAEPEGLVSLADGTLIIAEQGYNRILALLPDASTFTVLRTLPGVTSTAACKDGVDGIALDTTTNTLIIPDSPTGDVYRMSLDGKSFTLLTSGIVRPVGATVDGQGNIYVADECGGALWRVAPNGTKTRFGGFGMLDDVVLDTHGNALVIDLQIPVHALIRLNLATGQHETLASAGFIEPQGLVIDGHDNIWVSDDYANIIMEYSPA